MGGVSQRTNSSVPTLYGKFAATRMGGVRCASGSMSNASPSITCNCPGYRAAISASAGKQRPSFSIANTRRAPSDNNPRVKPPGPGPTSSTSHPDRSPAWRAIFAVRFKSNKKFCPKDLRALNPWSEITARKGGRSSMVLIASLFSKYSRRRHHWPAMAAASLMASIMLVGLATPRPAISKAVP